MDPRKGLVARGYDRMRQRYADWSSRIDDEPRATMVASLVERLPHGARVLELGCGDGTASTRELARRFRVTGVDLSHAQLEAAKRDVPGAEFIEADMTALQMPTESFDGVVALYAISHVPREEHAALFARINQWLVPGGLFLATLGAIDSPDWTGEWLGEPMYFSGYDAETNRRLLRTAGFELLSDDILVTREVDGDVRFLWTLAQKPTNKLAEPSTAVDS